MISTRTQHNLVMMLVMFTAISTRSCIAFTGTASHRALMGNRFSMPSSVSLFSTGGGRVSSAVQDKEMLDKTSTSSSKQKKRERLDTNPPKGTRDFFPEDLRMRNWLFTEWRGVAATYGFSEYDSPVLESESLYTRKAGEEVTQQLYSFEDKGGRRVSLRPEMTPSLARMVMSKKGGLPMPLKWFSLPQCWRYERMTRGRRREHYQWNMVSYGFVKQTCCSFFSHEILLFLTIG